jgi:hypothetical protein
LHVKAEHEASDVAESRLSDAIFARGKSLYFKGCLRQADEDLCDAVERYRALVRRDDAEKLVSFVNAIVIRGMNRVEQEQYAAADEDLGEAVQMYGTLEETHRCNVRSQLRAACTLIIFCSGRNAFVALSRIRVVMAMCRPRQKRLDRDDMMEYHQLISASRELEAKIVKILARVFDEEFHRVYGSIPGSDLRRRMRRALKSRGVSGDMRETLSKVVGGELTVSAREEVLNSLIATQLGARR